jgi:phosphoadenosine phosphosulfate reductase
MNKEQIVKLQEKAKGLDAQGIIRLAYQEFGRKLVFATSLGEEDQVITDLISQVTSDIDIFTLDTGRLFQETYDLLDKTQKRYPKLKFKIYYPNTQHVETMVQEKGINLFYESIENRKLCCNVRKVEPLRRALLNADAWMVGLRRQQAVTRATLEIFEWDDANSKIKVNPLADWSLEDVHKYIKEHNLDVNPLHSKGFLSIGCACCTRAIKPGEDIRAGRWWWEQPEQKECGLHNNPKWAGNRK